MASSKAPRIVGWVLSGLISLFLIGGSAMGKFTEWEGKSEMFEKMGFTVDLMYKIGVLEVILAVLLLIPSTAFIGAILLTGYLGGATLTHLRAGEPFFMPVLIGIVIWISLGLRNRDVFSLAFGLRPKSAER